MPEPATKEEVAEVRAYLAKGAMGPGSYDRRWMECVVDRLSVMESLVKELCDAADRSLCGPCSLELRPLITRARTELER